jgi:hypothetical protein
MVTEYLSRSAVRLDAAIKAALYHMRCLALFWQSLVRGSPQKGGIIIHTCIFPIITANPGSYGSAVIGLCAWFVTITDLGCTSN